tara:strand:- start:2092 stop:4767 length:2676 start_codon:yes stop_codon:yes gene_type:complete
MARHEIEIALDSASLSRVKESMASIFGKKFWQSVSKEASHTYEKHFKSFHKLSDQASRDMGDKLDTAMSEAVSNYSDDLKEAAQKGAKAYLDSTQRVMSRVSKIQEKNDADRMAMVKKIADEEMRALDERLSKEKKALQDQKKQAGQVPSAPPSSIVPPTGDPRTDRLTGMISGASSMVGGKGGALLSKLLPMAARLGPVIGAVAAMGTVAKKSLEISQSIQSMNKSMLATRGASDIFATGAYDVQEGINTIRQSFTDNFLEMSKWRMTSEEALDTLNEFSSAGIRIADAQKSLGLSTQDTAMKMVTSARAYGTVLGVQSGTVIEHMSNMTKNLGYSFDSAVESLAAVDMYAQRSGLSVGTFFSKVQSLNSQVNLMNSSFKVQAKLLSDVTRNSSVGVERAGQAAERLMSAMDFDTGMKVVANMDSESLDRLLRRRLSVAESMMASGDLDASGMSRMSSYVAELTQAIRGLSRGDMLEVGDLLTTGLTDSVTEMSLRMGAVSKVFGKTMDTLSARDLTQGVTREQRRMLQEMAGLGSDQEVQETLMVMSDLLRRYGSFDKAIESLERSELQSNLSEQISEDMRIARAQLEMTESVSKTLTQMRDILYERVYDVLFDIHTFLTKSLAPYLGTETSIVGTAIDQAMRKTSDAIYEAQKQGDTDRVKELNEGLKRLEKERTVMAQLSPEQLEHFKQLYGRGGMDEALRHRYGYGYGKSLGSVAESGGDVYRAISPEMREVFSKQKSVWGEHAKWLAAEIADQNLMEAQNMVDVMKWASSDANAHKGLPYEVTEILYAQQKGLIDTQSHAYQNLSKVIDKIETARIPALAQGGVVDRPTIALIGEAGPEAVVPLNKGMTPESAFNFNVYGNVYSMDDLNQLLARAMRERDRSRKI